VTSGAKTILVMSRGPRLAHLFRSMAEELSQRHRVVLVTFPSEAGMYEGLSVEVRHLTSRDVVSTGPDMSPVDDDTLKARVRVIEQRLGIPLYRMAGNDLLYARIIRSYGGHWQFAATERDFLLACVESFDSLSKVFDEVQPDVVYFENLDLISTHVALALAYHAGRFALQASLAALASGIFIAYGVRRTNLVMEHLLAHPSLITRESYASADEVLAEPVRYLYDTPYARFNRGTLQANSPVNPSRLLRVVREKGAVANGLRNLRMHARSAINRPWLNRHLAKTLPNSPYVAFALSRLPEASTCSQAPRWVNQEATAEQLAVNAPSWLKIVVKEHPRSYGLRGRDVLGPLADLPNVVLLHPSVPNQELVSRAEAVLATTGTTGLEGIVLGNRVGVLARPYYSRYAGAKKLSSPDELFEMVDNPAWAPERFVEERRNFLAAYFQSLHTFGRDGKSLYPPDGGSRWARALMATLDFVDAHGLRPNQFDPVFSVN
jgi:hypothetical protein